MIMFNWSVFRASLIFALAGFVGAAEVIVGNVQRDGGAVVV